MKRMATLIALLAIISIMHMDAGQDGVITQNCQDGPANGSCVSAINHALIPISATCTHWTALGAGDTQPAPAEYRAGILSCATAIAPDECSDAGSTVYCNGFPINVVPLSKE